MNQYEMKQIAYKSTLKSRALQVLVYLIDRSNTEGTCYAAISTMSQELHISVSTVKRALKELTVSGFVKKESRFREKNNGQTSNLYILCFAGISKSKELNEETKKKVHIRKENRNKPHTMEDALTSISIFRRWPGYCNIKIISFIALYYISYWPGEGANLIPP